MAALAMPVYYSGRVATLERWFERLERDRLMAADPAIPVFATWVHALRARPEAARRCLALCESLPETSGPMPDGTLTIGPWLVLARAVMCARGVAEMRADAENALTGLAPESLWRPTGFLLVGYARLLAGDASAADLSLSDAAERAAELGTTDTFSLATAQRALLAGERGDHDLAEDLSAQAMATMEARGLSEYMTSAIPLVASARTALRHGDGNTAQRFLAHAKRITPWLSYAIPWFAVLTWLEIGRMHRALADGGGVATALAEIDAIRKHRPDLGILTEQADDLRREIETMPKPEGRWSSSLTAAELRLLPLLATHLSFREIGERLFVTRNTVKTQAISVYRKLGVSSRSEAIQRAAERGLVDAAAVPSARLLAPSGS
jgi:LuxR family maltose regulon positive regulatory protein